ncbi:MAG: AAA family ATPase [bacterium]|nr:AAA family ATPase [bacterium]
MISKINLKNFIHFKDFTWNRVGKLNVIIGENDTGKTNLLKLLYSTSRAWSIFTANKKNNRDIPFDRTLADKIFNTFQPRFNGIGALVSQKNKNKLEAEIVYFANSEHKQGIIFNIAGDSGKLTLHSSFIDPCKEENFNSIFIPPKEVLTAWDAILSTRVEDKWMYGFDDTYKDLIHSLLLDTVQGKQQGELPTVTRKLGKLFGGKIAQVKDAKEKFVFSKNNKKYSMAMTAEGIKKLGIHTTLINNRQLHHGTILFLDEPEAVLHPKAINALGEMLYNFSESGIQVFVNTHSYFLLKRLELIARKKRYEIQCCSLKNVKDEVSTEISDLQEGMPDNPIVDEALTLMDEELDVA